jgi:uncharacterized membrane protein
VSPSSSAVFSSCASCAQYSCCLSAASRSSRHLVAGVCQHIIVVTSVHQSHPTDPRWRSLYPHIVYEQLPIVSVFLISITLTRGVSQVTCFQVRICGVCKRQQASCIRALRCFVKHSITLFPLTAASQFMRSILVSPRFLFLCAAIV